MRDSDVGDVVEGILDHVEDDGRVGLLDAVDAHDGFDGIGELVPVLACDPDYGIAVPGDIEHGHDLGQRLDAVLDRQEVALDVDLYDAHVVETELHVIEKSQNGKYLPCKYHQEAGNSTKEIS